MTNSQATFNYRVLSLTGNIVSAIRHFPGINIIIFKGEF